MLGDTSYKKYLTPEQTNDAQTMGWLGAANALADMSAPRPGGVTPSVFQLLAGGLRGYMGGSGDYVNQLAAYYKPMEEMRRNEQMNEYLASDEGKKYSTGLGLPSGMPVDPNTITTLASNRAKKTSELQLEQFYKPTTEGLIEQAKNPALISRAAGTEAAELPYKQQLANYNANMDVWKKGATLPYEQQLEDYKAQIARQNALSRPVSLKPGEELVIPSQMMGGDNQKSVPLYKNNTVSLDPQSRKLIAENRKTNLASDVALQQISRLESLNQNPSNTYDGAFAGIRSNLAANLPFTSDAKIKNTSEFDMTAKRLVMDILGGSLGVGISEGDRKFLENTIPEISDTNKQRAAKLAGLRAYIENKKQGNEYFNRTMLQGGTPETMGASPAGGASKFSGWSFQSN